MSDNTTFKVKKFSTRFNHIIDQSAFSSSTDVDDDVSYAHHNAKRTKQSHGFAIPSNRGKVSIFSQNDVESLSKNSSSISRSVIRSEQVTSFPQYPNYDRMHRNKEYDQFHHRGSSYDCHVTNIQNHGTSKRTFEGVPKGKQRQRNVNFGHKEAGSFFDYNKYRQVPAFIQQEKDATYDTSKPNHEGRLQKTNQHFNAQYFSEYPHHSNRYSTDRFQNDPYSEPQDAHYDHPLFGRETYHQGRSRPDTEEFSHPARVPHLSDVAKIMSQIKEKASKELVATKEMISNFIPIISEPQQTFNGPTDLQTVSSARMDHQSSSHSTATSLKERRNSYSEVFSRTAQLYKSNWVASPPKVKQPESSSKGEGEEEEEDKRQIIHLSENLEVDLNEVDECQINLITKYLKHKTRSLKTVANNVPLRGRKRSEDEDVVEGIGTRSAMDAFNSPPKPIPGTVTCVICQEYNLPPEKYRRHVNSDFHCWMDGTWRFKLTGHIPRFALIWCIICKDFFMLTFEGNTIVGHEGSKKHKRSLAILKLQYDNFPKIKYCFLSDLRTTKVKLPTPLKCKYILPKEALNMYKAAYSKLCERNLVSD